MNDYIALLLSLVYNFIAGYYISMSLLIDNPEFVTFNYNKIYFAILISALGGILHLLIMLFDDCSNINMILFIFFIILSGVMIYYIKQQIWIDEKQYLLTMIEQHGELIGLSNLAKKQIDNE